MGEGEEVEILLALVFLGMMLRKGQDTQKRTKKKKKQRKTKGRRQVSTKKEKKRKRYINST